MRKTKTAPCGVNKLTGTVVTRNVTNDNDSQCLHFSVRSGKSQFLQYLAMSPTYKAKNLSLKYASTFISSIIKEWCENIGK